MMSRLKSAAVAAIDAASSAMRIRNEEVVERDYSGAQGRGGRVWGRMRRSEPVTFDCSKRAGQEAGCGPGGPRYAIVESLENLQLYRRCGACRRFGVRATAGRCG